jgi:hypothetical protein
VLFKLLLLLLLVVVELDHLAENTLLPYAFLGSVVLSKF